MPTIQGCPPRWSNRPPANRPVSRTNRYTYTNGLVQTTTNPNGLTLTNLYDHLGRRVCVQYPDGTFTSNAYSALALAGRRDRLGHWTLYGRDEHGRLVGVTNVLGNTTTYSYCNCGSPESITDALNHTTTFTYDDLGRRVRTDRADGTWTDQQYNFLDEVTNVTDSTGYCVTNWFDYQGRLYASQQRRRSLDLPRIRLRGPGLQVGWDRWRYPHPGV